MKVDNSIQQSYAKLSSGNKINSAGDDPSGLVMSEQLNSQISGYNQGTDNALAAQDLTQTAEGALSNMSDSLQRIRELAVQASNGAYSIDDKRAIQDEINQIKNDIQQSAKNTEFNTMKVLDGSFSNKNIASGPSGTGNTMSIKSTTLETLGIDNFDVTQSFDVSTIDNAIAQVSDSRANLGSISNSIDYMVNANNTASANLSASNSQISGIDMAQAISDLKNQQLQQKVQIYAQQSKMNQSTGILNLLK